VDECKPLPKTLADNGSSSVKVSASVTVSAPSDMYDGRRPSAPSDMYDMRPLLELRSTPKCSLPLSLPLPLPPLLRASAAAAVDESRGPPGRGLNSFTSQINLSAFYGIGGARRSCVARVKGVFRGVQGVKGVMCVSDTAQVELKRERV